MKLLYTLIIAFFISCSTESEDCAGVAGGNSYMDDCGGCDANVNNDGFMDDCGVCDTDTTNDNSTCEEDCAGAWGGLSYLDGCGICDANVNNDGFMDDCGLCGGDSQTCTDDCGVPFGSNLSCMGCIDSAAENYGDWIYPCENCCYYDMSGDMNGDGGINVLDVVAVVNNIINDIIPDEDEDVIADGIFDILDATILVSMILGSRQDTATIVHFYVEQDATSITSDGWIGGIQMTLTHGADFTINLTNNAMVAEYVTNGTVTKLVVIVPESDELFQATGDFEIIDIKVGGDMYYINSYIN